MLKTIKLIFLLISGLSVCKAQAVIPDDVKENIKARIDQSITPGIVVAVIDGDILYYSQGVKSLKTKQPVNEQNSFGAFRRHH